MKSPIEVKKNLESAIIEYGFYKIANMIQELFNSNSFSYNRASTLFRIMRRMYIRNYSYSIIPDYLILK